MKKILVAAMAAVFGLAAGSAQAQAFKPDPNMNYKVLAFRAVESGTLQGTVAAVDTTARTIGIKGASGKVRTLKAGKNVQGLDKIGVEDAIVAEYYKSATFFVEKPGSDSLKPEVVTAFAAASKTNEVIEAAEIAAEGTATVASVDSAAGTVTFTGPGGRNYTVKPETPALVAGLSAGQKVDYKVIEVVAIDVKVTPKPAPAPPPPPPAKAKIEGKKIVIMDVIYFDTNKASIKPVSFDILNDVATIMKQNPGINVRVEGHASKDPASAKRGKAGAEYNLKLSDARAKSVKAYLVEKGGIDAKRLEGVGFGWNQPIAPNNTKEGRAKNQRVDFVITN